MGCSRSHVTTVRQFTWNEIFCVVRPSFRFSCIPKINLLLLPVPVNTEDYITLNHEILCQQNQPILKIILYYVAFWCRMHLWFRLMGGLQAKSMTSQRYRAVTRWRICVTMATLWQQQDSGYVLLWQRYDNNKMVAMRYYSTSSTVQS